MKKSLLLIVLVIMVSSVFAQFKKDRTSAFSYWNKANYVKAKESIDKAITYPEAATDAKVWFFRGNIYYDIQANSMSALLAPDAVSVAYEAYKKALELDTQGEFKADISARIAGIGGEFFNLGLDLFKQANYSSALDYFEKAIGISKANHTVDTMAYYASGLSNKALYTTEKPEYLAKAVERFQYLVDIKFKMEDLYIDLANIYSMQGEFSKAKNVIALGKQFFPTSAGITIADANIDLQEKNFSKAIEKLNIAIAADPTNATIYHAIGVSYDQMKNDASLTNDIKETYFQEAVKSYDKALEIDPDMFDAAFNAGVLYFNRGGDVVNEANKLPINETAKYDAMLAEGKGYLNKALPYLEKCELLNPNDKDTLSSLKEIYTRLGMAEKLKTLNEKLQ